MNPKARTNIPIKKGWVNKYNNDQWNMIAKMAVTRMHNYQDFWDMFGFLFIRPIYESKIKHK